MNDGIKTLFVTGYRSYEMGVFKEDDPKVAVIKNVLKKRLIDYLEAGLEWILVGGNLGVEIWAAQVALELKGEYPDLKVAVIFPFLEFGSQWKENNQALLQGVKNQVDFVEATSHQSYENPQQLRNHTNFLLAHTGGVLLVYDEEFPGKSQYFLKDAQKFSTENAYQIDKITMDDLQNSILEG
ncbi:DUF1273 domain-containing protein [Enterococcus asini]|uniref:DUF1273 domain-containing protein n=1 Tax=Enterococcus TaxID=1350 RepID=UPI0028901372|nr:DUF1273 domain-containing protein [Enterococcus asini]MDT2757822.1 DUF1273 domain-containing protein [Enterococcus asini]